MKKKTKNQKTENLSGTRQWAEKNVNFIKGCKHNCLYCYAKEQIVRTKNNTIDGWEDECLRIDVINKNYRYFNGLIMIPSSHDITPKHLSASILFLKKFFCFQTCELDAIHEFIDNR